MSKGATIGTGKIGYVPYLGGTLIGAAPILEITENTKLGI